MRVAILAVLLVAAVYCGGGGGDVPAFDAKDVVVLSEADFYTQTANGNWLVEFYAPWCGHCKRLAPTWAELATKSKSENWGFNVANVDCTIQKDVCTSFGVRGYPTVKFLSAGTTVYDYKGQRTIDDFRSFATTGFQSATGAAFPKKN